jgi:hypothetical protein
MKIICGGEKEDMAKEKRSKMSMDAVVIPWAADVFPFSSKIPDIFA